MFRLWQHIAMKYKIVNNSYILNHQISKELDQYAVDRLTKCFVVVDLDRRWGTHDPRDLRKDK